MRLDSELITAAWKKPPPEAEIRALLEAGADPDARDWMQRPALSTAIGSQNIGIAKILLGAGADPDAKDSFGTTPLMWAVDAGVAEMIPVLLKAGADIDAQDSQGETALMKAAMGGKGRFAALLIDAHAKLDLQSAFGNTALTVACLNSSDLVDNGQAGIARLLADRGADIALKNKDGKAGVDYLRTRNQPELLAYIESAPARREAARGKLVVPKPAVKLKPLPRKPPKP
jgi:ankyrin repeat protein